MSGVTIMTLATNPTPPAKSRPGSTTRLFGALERAVPRLAPRNGVPLHVRSKAGHIPLTTPHAYLSPSSLPVHAHPHLMAN